MMVFMMKKIQTKIIQAITLLLILGLFGCSTTNVFDSPLAPTMELTTPTLPETLDGSHTTDMTATDATSETEAVIEVSPTTEPTENVEPASTSEQTTCGQTGSMTLLIIGSDTLGSSKPNGADAIRIVKADFDEQTIKIITFPRDLIVQTASVNSAAQMEQKLGLTYYEAFSAAPGSSVEKNAIGASVVAQLLLNNFDLRSEHYLTLQMDQFAAMVDTVGGVEINFPEAITTEHNITFNAGVQTLNGAMATEYVRFLNPGGEDARTARQNAFLKALQEKMISLEILPQIPNLMSQLQYAVITDLSVDQLVNLTCLAVTMPKANVTFGAISAPDLMVNNVPNIAKIKDYLTKTLGD